MLIVTDPTQRGIVAAERIAGLRNDLEVDIENAYLIVNRVTGDIPGPLMDRIEKMDIQLLGSIPADETLVEFEFEGRPLVELGDESPVYQAVAEMMEKILT